MATQYYPDKDLANHTQINKKMRQQTTSVNEILTHKLPYEVLVSGRYPGSRFALFDISRFLSNIYYNPSAYLNGSRPITVQDWERQCDPTGEECVFRNDGESPDSFMWWDELHPSEQVHRLLAKEVLETLDGRSEYATYWSS
jgi:phospholipase/lecithinase/hemolysin